MGEFYVYCHQRNDNGKCFYIGKGKLERYKETKSRNKHWRNIVKKANGFSAIILVSGVTEELAFSIEKDFISQIGIQNLANISEGGTGGNVFVNIPKEKMEDIRKRMSDSAKKRIRGPVSQETKRKMSEALTGLKKKPHSTDTKNKISNKLKGHVFSKDTKIKLSLVRSEKNTGKKWYTDGDNNYFRLPGTEPSGSYLGRTKSEKS
jgi:hypothetical protein